MTSLQDIHAWADSAKTMPYENVAPHASERCAGIVDLASQCGYIVHRAFPGNAPFDPKLVLIGTVHDRTDRAVHSFLANALQRRLFRDPEDRLLLEGPGASGKVDVKATNRFNALLECIGDECRSLSNPDPRGVEYLRQLEQFGYHATADVRRALHRQHAGIMHLVLENHRIFCFPSPSHFVNLLDTLYMRMAYEFDDTDHDDADALLTEDPDAFLLALRNRTEQGFGARLAHAAKEPGVSFQALGALDALVCPLPDVPSLTLLPATIELSTSHGDKLFRSLAERKLRDADLDDRVSESP